MSMAPTLWRASLRHSLRHPWQFGLSLLGIALGVAVVVAVDLSVESARRAFTLSNEAVLGRATHRLRGGPSGIDERLYARLRRSLPSVSMAPVVEAWVATPGPGGPTLRLLGVDPFAEAPFRAHLDAAADGGEALAALLSRPRTVLASAGTAARLGAAPGEEFAVVVDGREVGLALTARIEARPGLARESLADLLVADIATAQEVLGRIGRVDHVDLIVAPGAEGEETLRRLRALLPAGVRVEAVGARAGAAEQMTRAFNLNLLMLSLLAVVVGMFLVYNTMTFSVVQRRELFGMLRAMGVVRAEIFRMVLAEACAVACVAALAGAALGLLLATGLVDLVTRTINDLYFAVSVRAVSVSPWVIAKALALGLGAALAAALMPAWEATHVAPRAALARSMVESSVRRRVPLATLAGLLILLLAVLLLWLPGAGLGAGFAALFAMVVGFALLAPGASLLVLRVLQPLAVGVAGWIGRLATRGVAAHFSRTAVAIAALMVALSATVGVGLMVDSFRRSVAQWLDVTLRADLYVGLPGEPGARALEPGLAGRVARLPGVADVSTGRGVTVQAATGPVELVALEMAKESYGGFILIEGEARGAWDAFDDAGAVLVSEPYSRRHGVHPGDEVEIFTDRGPRRFPVAAVFRDYGSEHGAVVLARDTYERYWDDPHVSTIGVYAAEGVDVAALADAVRGAVRSDQRVVVQPNRRIKEASMEVFDRTFKVTAVLRVLATVIAFVGVLSALMALVLERAKEVAVLRAQGLTPREVWALVQTQTAAMGVIAGVLCVPLGVAMALVLILVINRRSFGWSMAVHVDPVILAQALGLAVAAALLAGVYPAYRMARIPPAEALRED